MRRARVTTSGHQWVDYDGMELDVSYTAVASMHYDPGRVSGPPEQCYPPEGECDIEDVIVELVENSSGEEVNSEEILRNIKSTLKYSVIEEQLWESFHEH